MHERVQTLSQNIDITFFNFCVCSLSNKKTTHARARAHMCIHTRTPTLSYLYVQLKQYIMQIICSLNIEIIHSSNARVETLNVVNTKPD